MSAEGAKLRRQLGYVVWALRGVNHGIQTIEDTDPRMAQELFDLYCMVNSAIVEVNRMLSETPQQALSPAIQMMGKIADAIEEA